MSLHVYLQLLEVILYAGEKLHCSKDGRDVLGSKGCTGKGPDPTGDLAKANSATLRSWEGWEHHICSFYICMITAEDRRWEDGRQDCEMFFVDRTRIPEQMLPWKVLFEFLRDKKESCATVLLFSPVQGRRMRQSESLKEESREWGKNVVI